MINTRFILAIGIITLFELTLTGCQQQSNIATGDVVKIQTLEVNYLKIVDTTGKSRGAFHAMPDGSTSLNLSDDKGLPKCGLIVTSGGDPVLEVADNTGKTRIALGLKKDGTPVMSMADETGKVRNLISMYQDGSSAIEFYDKNIKQRLTAGLRADGSPVLQLADDSGETRVALSVLSNNTVGLEFYDKDRKTKAGVLINAENEPEVVFHDKQALETAMNKRCHSNLRVLTGAIEMYNLDHPAMIQTFNQKTMSQLGTEYLKDLQAKPEKYLCPGNPPGIYVSDGDLSGHGFLKCTTHGNPKNLLVNTDN